MSGKARSQLFGRRISAEGFHSTQYSFQPVNRWFERRNNPPIEMCLEDKLKERTEEHLDATDGPAKEDLPGSGTVVAVLDTGIQYDHLAFKNHEVEFEDKVILHKNFLNPQEDCEDHNGHGTECAGMACGLNFTGARKNETGKEKFYKFSSPAPGAKLMVCKVANSELDDEEHSLKATIEALKFIVDYNEKMHNAGCKVDVISISFGYEHFNKQLAMAIQEAINNDIIVVCCASNDGRNTQNPICYPARLGHVLCIGACDRYGQAARLSSVGKEVDFVALGESVWAPSIGYRNDVVKVLDGTSYSTPSVAGLICHLLQDIKRLSITYNCPQLYVDMHNVWCMRDLLKTMSAVRGHHDDAIGYGRLEPEREYFKKGDEEKIRICKQEILGMS